MDIQKLFSASKIRAGAALLSVTLLFSCSNGPDAGEEFTEDPTLVALATGSSNHKIVTDGTTTYEVHEFVYNSGPAGTQTAYTLALTNELLASASILVVAGGGGGGGSLWADEQAAGGGGGAGGVIYKLNEITLTSPVAVSVGQGGAGGAGGDNTGPAGENGQNSSVGSEVAYGGGGGGGSANNTEATFAGASGGSSGGGGTESSTPKDALSEAPRNSGQQGHKGGASAVDNEPGNTFFSGGGGGGSYAIGTDGKKGKAGEGGTGTDYPVPGFTLPTLAAGGNGGRSSSVANELFQETPRALSTRNFGDGGDAGFGGNEDRALADGIAGKEGIVYIWWEYQAPVTP